MMISVH